MWINDFDDLNYSEIVNIYLLVAYKWYSIIVILLCGSQHSPEFRSCSLLFETDEITHG